MILSAPLRNWKCPSCLTTDQTQRPDAHTQFHNCPALGGISIPLVEVKYLDQRPDARQVVVAREDNGQMASVRTERADGSNDCTVFAPTATVSAEGRGF